MLDEILELLYRPITTRMEKMMATAEELKAQLQEAKDSLQSAISRIEEDVLNLKNQVESGINPTDLDPISAGLAELKNNLDALDPDPDNPAPAP